MKVGFTVGTAANEAASWAALEGPFVPDEFGVMEGRLTLSDDGVLDVEIEDDLQFLVPNLCLRMPPRLAAEGSATVRTASMGLCVTLRRDGETVLLTDDGAELGRFPYDGLTRALRECAERFAEYVGALAVRAPEWGALESVLRSSMDGSKSI